MGLSGKVLVVGGYRGGFCEQLPPCLIEPMPASSLTDLRLAKAKPIGNGGSASVITHLRGRKKTPVKRQ